MYISDFIIDATGDPLCNYLPNNSAQQNGTTTFDLKTEVKWQRVTERYIRESASFKLFSEGIGVLVLFKLVEVMFLKLVLLFAIGSGY